MSDELRRVIDRRWRRWRNQRRFTVEERTDLCMRLIALRPPMTQKAAAVALGVSTDWIALFEAVVESARQEMKGTVCPYCHGSGYITEAHDV